MSFNDLRLRTKTMIPLGLMALTVLAMAALGATQLRSLSADAGDIIEKREVGMLQLARATRSILYVPYSVFAAIDYDDDTDGAKAAKADFGAVGERASSEFDSAAKVLPAEALRYE